MSIYIYVCSKSDFNSRFNILVMLIGCKYIYISIYIYIYVQNLILIVVLIFL